MINKIIIAVDARPLSDPLTGIGRYLFETLKIMVKNQGVTWRLYSHKSFVYLPDYSSNIEIFACNFNNRLLRMIWAQFMLPWFLYINKPTHFWSPAHRIPSLLSSKIKRIVTIHDFVWFYHGDTMRPFSRLLDSLLMPHAIRLADEIITVSKNTAMDLSNLFPLYASKVSVIPLAATKVSTNSLICDSIKNLINNGPYFLFVGTLEPRKNLHRLIEAFSKSLPLMNSGMRLVIVGGLGWGGVDLNSLIKKFSIESYVNVVGFVNDNELALLYSKATFLALPSLYEGFGLPLIEAMSCGTPTLSSNISSMPEIVGDTGVLVNPYSIDSIASGLILLANSSDLRNRLRENSFKRIKQYSWELTAKKTFQVLVR